MYKKYTFYANPEDGLLEKSVENKSFLKFNFKKLLYSILFSRMYSLGNMEIRQIHVRKTANIYILVLNDLSTIFFYFVSDTHENCHDRRKYL